MSLEIYVEAGCSTCERARELADQVARHYPKLAVDVVDISDTDREVPEAVFAVPTYVFNGAVISLGNPSYEELTEKLNGSLVS